MRKLLLATVALAAFALASPASAQIYIGPQGFYVQIPQIIIQAPPPPPPVIIQQAPQPQPQVIIQQPAPPPPVVVQPAPPPPPVVVQPPPVQSLPGQVCFVHTSGVNVRQWVWGPIVYQLPYGAQVHIWGEPQYSWDGVPWYQTDNGWISITPLTC